MKKILVVFLTMIFVFNGIMYAQYKFVTLWDDGQHLGSNIYLYYGRDVTYDNNGKEIHRENHFSKYKFVNNNPVGVYKVCYELKKSNGDYGGYYCTSDIASGKYSGPTGLPKGDYVSTYEIIKK